MSPLGISLIVLAAVLTISMLGLLGFYIRYLWKRIIRSGRHEWHANEPKLVKKALEKFEIKDWIQ